MKNVLVTGGAGFIGSNFIHHLLARTPVQRVVNLDALTYAGTPANLAEVQNDTRYRFVHADICDGEKVQALLREEHVDTIVHFAADTHVDRSIRDPETFYQTNVLGTLRLLEAARAVWAGDYTGKRFHHISTDEVYGTLEPGDPPFSESTPYIPRSPYAASKAAADHLVRSFFHTYGLPVTLSNCSNNYGPRQYPEKFIPLVIQRCLRGERIPIYGDGRQIRDWIYVEDHCCGILRILQDGRPGETYHLGGGNQPTNLEIANLICDLMDRKRPQSAQVPHRRLLQFITDRPGHDRRYAMDCTKIERELGWTPQIHLIEGLEQTVDWYLDHPEWLEAVTRAEPYRAWMREQYQGEA